MNFSQHFNKRQKEENSTADGSESAVKAAPIHQKLLQEITTKGADKTELLRTVFQLWIDEKNLNKINKANCMRGLETLIQNIQNCES